MCFVSVALPYLLEQPFQLIHDAIAGGTAFPLVASDGLGTVSVIPAVSWADTFLRELTTFVLAAAAVMVGILAIAVLVVILRSLGYGGALEITDILDRWIGPLHGGNPRPLVNVEYRDAENVPMHLGSFIRSTLRNSRGKFFLLVEGAFVDCEPAWIKAGALVHVSVQDGLVREELYVRIDRERDLLFVKSKYSLSEMFEKINRASQRGEAAE